MPHGPSLRWDEVLGLRFNGRATSWAMQCLGATSKCALLKDFYPCSFVMKFSMDGELPVRLSCLLFPSSECWSLLVLMVEAWLAVGSAGVGVEFALVSQPLITSAAKWGYVPRLHERDALHMHN
jgi:hypothetical protein